MGELKTGGVRLVVKVPEKQFKTIGGGGGGGVPEVGSIQ